MSTGGARMANDTSIFQVGYDDFLILCHVDDVNEWSNKYRIQRDGVYVRPTPDDVYLTPAERQMLAHPTGDDRAPLLTFPSSIYHLLKWLDDEGIGQIGNLDVVEWLGRRIDAELELAKRNAQSNCKSGSNIFDYPKELNAACEAYEAVFYNPELLKTKSPKHALVEWLKKHRKGLGYNAIKRVSIVANWQPKGGTPKTPA